MTWWMVTLSAVAVFGALGFFVGLSPGPSPFRMMRFRRRIKRWGTLEAYAAHREAAHMERTAAVLMDKGSSREAAKALAQAHVLRAQADAARKSRQAGALSVVDGGQASGGGEW